MDNPLRNAFVIKMENLLPQDKVFKQRGPTPARFQTVLIITDRVAKIVSKFTCTVMLLKFAAISDGLLMCSGFLGSHRYFFLDRIIIRLRSSMAPKAADFQETRDIARMSVS